MIILFTIFLLIYLNLDGLHDSSFLLARPNVKDYTKEDWARKVIEMKYWLLKTHRDILGENWRAPKEVVDLAARYKDIEETAKRAIHGQIKRIRGYPEEQAMRNITQMYLDNIYKGMMYF